MNFLILFNITEELFVYKDEKYLQNGKNRHIFSCCIGKEDIVKEKRNQSTVYLWEPTQEGFINKIRSVGHISLRTYVGEKDDNGIYASFWPKDSNCPCVHLDCNK